MRVRFCITALAMGMVALTASACLAHSALSCDPGHTCAAHAAEGVADVQGISVTRTSAPETAPVSGKIELAATPAPIPAPPPTPAPSPAVETAKDEATGETGAKDVMPLPVVVVAPSGTGSSATTGDRTAAPPRQPPLLVLEGLPAHVVPMPLPKWPPLSSVSPMPTALAPTPSLELSLNTFSPTGETVKSDVFLVGSQTVIKKIETTPPLEPQAETLPAVLPPTVPAPSQAKHEVPAAQPVSASAVQAPAAPPVSRDPGQTKSAAADTSVTRLPEPVGNDQPAAIRSVPDKSASPTPSAEIKTAQPDSDKPSPAPKPAPPEPAKPAAEPTPVPPESDKPATETIPAAARNTLEADRIRRMVAGRDFVLDLEKPKTVFPNDQRDLNAIRKRGILVVAQQDGDNPPFFFYEPGTEKLTGFDVDIAIDLAKRLGLKLVINRSYPTFKSVALAVAAGEADLGVTNLSITEERQKIVDFTEPYIVGYLALLINFKTLEAALPKTEIIGPADLNSEKVTIAVEAASSFVGEIKGLFPKARILEETYGPNDRRYASLLDGRAQVMLRDTISMMGELLAHPEVLADRGGPLTYIPMYNTADPIGVPVAKTAPELKKAVDAYFDSLPDVPTTATVLKRYQTP